MKRTRLAAGAAILGFLSATAAQAEEPAVKAQASISINGQEVKIGAEDLRNMAGELLKVLPETSPEEMQRMIRMFTENGGGLLSSPAVRIEIDGREVKPEDIQNMIGGAVQALGNTTPKELATIVEQVIKNGNVQEMMSGLSVDSKAYVTGPDGKLREIEIGLGGGGGIAPVPQSGGFYSGGGGLDMGGELKPYYIGVAIESVPDLLREHIAGLQEGGVLVKSVYDGPAKEAGVLENDVIVSASGKNVGSREELISAVQEAGEKGESISLSILRKGSGVDVSVAPAKRELPPVVSGLFVPPAAADDGGKLDALMKEVMENRRLLEEILSAVRTMEGKKGD